MLLVARTRTLWCSTATAQRSLTGPCTSSSSSSSISCAHRTTQRRSYAQPVNAQNSVDARLGIVPPPAPLPQSQNSSTSKSRSSSSSSSSSSSFTVNPLPDNPNDLSELLRSTRGPTSGSASKQGTITSVKGTAMGAQRRSTAIPSSNLDDLSLLEAEARSRNALQEDGDKGPLGPGAQQPVDRESPHSIDEMHGRNDLDERILNAARATHARNSGASLRQLNDQFEREAYRVLPIELPYESTPSDARRVLLPKQARSQAQAFDVDVGVDVDADAQAGAVPSGVEGDDGVLLLAYVDNVDAPRGHEKVSVCTGFAVEGGKELAAEEGTDGGHLVVTVAHTLRSSIPGAQQSESQARDKSAALAISRSGAVYPIEQLVSSLPSSDLVLLRLASHPLSVQNTSGAVPARAPSPSVDAVKTLPISPYPAPQHSHLCVSSFWGFEDDSGCAVPRFVLDSSSSQLCVLPSSSAPAGRSASAVHSEGDAMSQSRWGEVRLVEYKDGKGSEAQPGTYDSLETLEYKLVRDSAINPAVLKGEKPRFLPSGTVSLGGGGGGGGGGSTTPHAGAAALQEIRASSPPSASPSSRQDAAQGFGGYGVPNFPPPGSSGGPIVDMNTGAVVGVTRGCKMTTLGGRRGEGVPSEKIFEFFTLPGMGKNKKKI